jgi:hypothetical protein
VGAAHGLGDDLVDDLHLDEVGGGQLQGGGGILLNFSLF